MMIDFKFLRFGKEKYLPIIDQEGGTSPTDSKLLPTSEKFRLPQTSPNKAKIPWMILTFILAALAGLLLFYDVRRSGRGTFDTGYHNDMSESLGV